MSDSAFYETDPDDPDAPVVIHEYRGLRPGMRVEYVWPNTGRVISGADLLARMTVMELVQWSLTDGTLYTEAICTNDPTIAPGDMIELGAQWEINADNLRQIAEDPTNQENT
jgi:hypothetical protein